MPQIRANGLDIGYDVVGEGPPLLLLHGASSGGSLDFGHQTARFRRQFTCYLPDARGHGATRWDADDGFSHEWLVDDTLAFADALGIGAFHALGFSMGAGTVLGVASREPGRILTLVVIGAVPDREPRASVARRLFDADRIKRDDPGWADALDRRHDPVQGDGAWERMLPVIGAAIATQRLLSPADLRRIDAPALVVAGDRDPFAPVDQVWLLKRQLPDGRLLIVPDGAHEVPARRPGIVNEALASFYRSTEAAAAARARRWAESHVEGEGSGEADETARETDAVTAAADALARQAGGAARQAGAQHAPAAPEEAPR